MPGLISAILALILTYGDLEQQGLVMKMLNPRQLLWQALVILSSVEDLNKARMYSLGK